MKPITINRVRYYRHEKKLLPSSTSILKETSPNKEQLLGWIKHHGGSANGQEAAKRGNFLHEAMGYLLIGDPTNAEYLLKCQSQPQDELRPFFKNLTIALNGMKALALEQPVYGPRWAGTFDALIEWQGEKWILELKTVADPTKITGDRRYDWALQAYSYGCLLNVEGIVVIMVSPSTIEITPILKTNWEPLALAWNDRLDQFYKNSITQAFQW